MRICVYGAGAVGGLMACWLARAGYEVSLVARGAQLAAIRANGLKLRSGPEGKIDSFPFRASDDSAALAKQDCVIVAVKAQDLAGVASGIAPLLGPDTSIITAMNGVPWWFFDRLAFGGGKLRLETLDPEGKLSRAMPTSRLVGCVVHLAASVPEPGLISHNMGKKLILGEPGGKSSGRAQRVAGALAAAGFEAVVTDSIEKEFWVKLLGNVSFNPVSVLTLATSDLLIGDQYVKDYMVKIMREVLEIGRAIGVDAAIDPEARIDMARALGRFKTSMLQDLEAGKALEIEGLFAGTLEIARKAGVAAPFTESLLGLVRRRAQATGQYRRAA